MCVGEAARRPPAEPVVLAAYDDGYIISYEYVGATRTAVSCKTLNSCGSGARGPWRQSGVL
jgi:hypothetical protein